MRLSSRQIASAMNQIGARPLPDNHPAATQLTRIFGDHTFFIDDEGLEIVEVIDPVDTGGQTATVVKLGNWADAGHTTLETHEPEATDQQVELATGPEPSA